MGFFSTLFGGGSDGKRSKGRPANEERGVTAVRRSGRDVMQVEDVFRITGRGVVVTGRLAEDLRVDEWVDVHRADGTRSQRVGGISVRNEMVQSAAAGTEAGVLLAEEVNLR
ncbi:hypothetical protein ACQBAU_09735 [Propionibacteriaceae bacterium Y2011]